MGFCLARAVAADVGPPAGGGAAAPGAPEGRRAHTRGSVSGGVSARLRLHKLPHTRRWGVRLLAHRRAGTPPCSTHRHPAQMCPPCRARCSASPPRRCPRLSGLLWALALWRRPRLGPARGGRRACGCQFQGGQPREHTLGGSLPPATRGQSGEGREMSAARVWTRRLCRVRQHSGRRCARHEHVTAGAVVVRWRAARRKRDGRAHLLASGHGNHGPPAALRRSKEHLAGDAARQPRRQGGGWRAPAEKATRRGRTRGRRHRGTCGRCVTCGGALGLTGV